MLVTSTLNNGISIPILSNVVTFEEEEPDGEEEDEFEEEDLKSPMNR
jgi:hypothetical protein